MTCVTSTEGLRVSVPSPHSLTPFPYSLSIHSITSRDLEALRKGGATQLKEPGSLNDSMKQSASAHLLSMVAWTRHELSPC